MGVRTGRWQGCGRSGGNSNPHYLTTTRQYTGTLQILLNHLFGMEYKTTRNPNNCLPQHKDNGQYKRHREWCNLYVYIDLLVNHIDLIASDTIKRWVGGIYVADWTCHFIGSILNIKMIQNLPGHIIVCVITMNYGERTVNVCNSNKPTWKVKSKGER